MVSYSKILELAPLAQSTALVGKNFELVHKKKKGVKDFVGVGVGTIIGAEFIKAESDLIKGL